MGLWSQTAPKTWCFWTVMLDKILESPLDSKEIKPVNPKGNKIWIFIGRTDAEAEALILWPFNVKSQLTGKDPARKDWTQEEKGVTEDEMVGCHHWLNGREFEQTLRDSKRQKSLESYSPRGHKRWTQLSNWTTKFTIYFIQSNFIYINLLYSIHI